MNRNKLMIARFAFLAAACVGSAAHAQSAACVYLEPGAGYAAWIRVVSGSFTSNWSSSFPIGQYRCVDMTPIANGAQYTVQISAVLGSSQVACQPANQTRSSAMTGSITFLASGTSLNVKCNMPVATSSTTVADVVVNPEGVKAAEAIKANPPAPPKD